MRGVGAAEQGMPAAQSCRTKPFDRRGVPARHKRPGAFLLLYPHTHKDAVGLFGDRDLRREKSSALSCCGVYSKLCEPRFVTSRAHSRLMTSSSLVQTHQMLSQRFGAILFLYMLLCV